MLSLIKKIESERKKANRLPICTKFTEVLNRSDKSRADVIKELNNLFKEGKIIAVEAINEKTIYTK